MTYGKIFLKNSASEKMYRKSCLLPANLQNPVSPGFKGKSFKMRNAVLHYKDEKDLIFFTYYETRWMNADGDEAWE